MNSKEALERINNVLLRYDEHYDYMDIEVIKQDLDRLEKLEQFVNIYKNTNNKFELWIQGKATNLPSPTLEQELLRKEVLENE